MNFPIWTIKFIVFAIPTIALSYISWALYNSDFDLTSLFPSTSTSSPSIDKDLSVEPTGPTENPYSVKVQIHPTDIYLVTQYTPSTFPDSSLKLSTNGVNNYQCQSRFKEESHLKDLNCQLYQINTSQGVDPSINTKLLNNHFIPQRNKAFLKENTFHILKISNTLYTHLLNKEIYPNDSDQLIHLIQNNSPLNPISFGSLKPLFKLDKTPSGPLKTPISLGYISSLSTDKHSSLSPTSQFACKYTNSPRPSSPFNCSILSQTPSLSSNTFNQKQTWTKWSSLSSISSLKNSNYISLNIKDQPLTPEEWKNITIDVFSLEDNEQKPLTEIAVAANKLFTWTHDQAIFGDPDSHEGMGVFMPLEKHTRTFIVNKESKSDYLSDLDNGEGTKNYRCKYSITNVPNRVTNYDDSCTLFKLTDQPSTQQSVNDNTLLFKHRIKASASDLSSSNQFKLEINSEALYNLEFNENVTADIKVSIVPNYRYSKEADKDKEFASLTIQQEFVGNTLVGKFNILYVYPLSSTISKTLDKDTNYKLTCIFDKLNINIPCKLKGTLPLNKTTVIPVIDKTTLKDINYWNWWEGSKYNYILVLDATDLTKKQVKHIGYISLHVHVDDQNNIGKEMVFKIIAHFAGGLSEGSVFYKM